MMVASECEQEILFNYVQVVPFWSCQMLGGFVGARDMKLGEKVPWQLNF